MTCSRIGPARARGSGCTGRAKEVGRSLTGRGRRSRTPLLDRLEAKTIAPAKTARQTPPDVCMAIGSPWWTATALDRPTTRTSKANRWREAVSQLRVREGLIRGWGREAGGRLQSCIP